MNCEVCPSKNIMCSWCLKAVNRISRYTCDKGSHYCCRVCHGNAKLYPVVQNKNRSYRKHVNTDEEGKLKISSDYLEFEKQKYRSIDAPTEWGRVQR